MATALAVGESARRQRSAAGSARPAGERAAPAGAHGRRAVEGPAAVVRPAWADGGRGPATPGAVGKGREPGPGAGPQCAVVGAGAERGGRHNQGGTAAEVGPGRAPKRGRAPGGAGQAAGKAKALARSDRMLPGGRGRSPASRRRPFISFTRDWRVWGSRSDSPRVDGQGFGQPGTPFLLRRRPV